MKFNHILLFPLSIALSLFQIRASSNNTMNILDRVSYRICLPFIIEAFTGAMGLVMVYIIWLLKFWPNYSCTVKQNSCMDTSKLLTARGLLSRRIMKLEVNLLGSNLFFLGASTIAPSTCTCIVTSTCGTYLENYIQYNGKIYDPDLKSIYYIYL